MQYLDYLYTDVNGVLNSTTIIVVLSVYPFLFANICCATDGWWQVPTWLPMWSGGLRAGTNPLVGR